MNILEINKKQGNTMASHMLFNADFLSVHTHTFHPNSDCLIIQGPFL